MDGYYTDGSVQDVGRDGHTVLVGGAGAWHANTHMGFTWAEYCPHVLPAELVAIRGGLLHRLGRQDTAPADWHRGPPLPRSDTPP